MVERADLPRFLFSPEDIMVAVGQDGLVANLAKYLDGQLIIGIDAEPGRNPGVLVRHPPRACAGLLALAVRGGTTELVFWSKFARLPPSSLKPGRICQRSP